MFLNYIFFININNWYWYFMLKSDRHKSYNRITFSLLDISAVYLTLSLDDRRILGLYRNAPPESIENDCKAC